MQSRLLLILMVVIAAFLAAFLGQIIINSLYSGPSLIPSQSLIVNRSNQETEELQKAQSQLQVAITQSHLRIYDKNLTEQVGTALTLSNDGWLIAVSDESTADWQSIQLSNGVVTPIVEIVEDTASNIVFLKVNSTELHPANLAREFNQELYEYVLYSHKKSLIPTRYLGQQQPLLSEYDADSLTYFPALNAGELSEVVYSTQEEVIGIIIKQQDSISFVMPSNELRSLFDQVLREGEISRPRFELTYRDSRYFPHLSNRSGVIITSLSTITKTPLNRSLVVGDQILSVDGESIEYIDSLTQKLQMKKIGDSLQIELLRDQKPLSINVTLE